MELRCFSIASGVQVTELMVGSSFFEDKNSSLKSINTWCCYLQQQLPYLLSRLLSNVRAISSSPSKSLRGMHVFTDCMAANPSLEKQVSVLCRPEAIHVATPLISYTAGLTSNRFTLLH